MSARASDVSASNIAIIGAGGVGLGLGSCLIAAGQRVCFVVRGERDAAALRGGGLSRSGLFGDERAGPGRFAVVRTPAELGERTASDPFDAVLVCTKSTATTSLGEALGPLWPSLGPATLLVVCHNGWGSAERFAAFIPRSRVYSARVITGFQRRAPNAVEITAHAQPIHIGSLFEAPVEPIAGLCAAIARGGIPCRPSNQIADDLWAKMLYNCALNPLGAILEVPYGELAGSEHTRNLMRAVVAEIFSLIGAAGFSTHWPHADRYLDDFYDALLPPTAAHESSMLQDLRAGRESEIDSLNGAVVELARRHGLEAPVNAALTALIHAIQARGKP